MRDTPKIWGTSYISWYLTYDHHMIYENSFNLHLCKRKQVTKPKSVR